MKLNAGCVLLAVIGSSVLGCSGDDRVKPLQFEYPLAAGSQWYYTRTLTQVAQADHGTQILVAGAAEVRVAAIEMMDGIGEVYRLDSAIGDAQTESPCS